MTDRTIDLLRGATPHKRLEHDGDDAICRDCLVTVAEDLDGGPDTWTRPDGTTTSEPPPCEPQP